MGGTSGIGHGIALTLARAGHDVTIAGRSSTAGQAIVDAMKEASPSNSFRFEKVDCFDLDNVKDLADRASKGPLDTLILTQGKKKDSVIIRASPLYARILRFPFQPQP